MAEFWPAFADPNKWAMFLRKCSTELLEGVLRNMAYLRCQHNDGNQDKRDSRNQRAEALKRSTGVSGERPEVRKESRLDICSIIGPVLKEIPSHEPELCGNEIRQNPDLGANFGEDIRASLVAGLGPLPRDPWADPQYRRARADPQGLKESRQRGANA